ncbi:hypothetical protein [Tenacibaculum ovolyticum]|uniref:hypothetical protein n=1 Tax=Tenacibaculum ovolyticum TaxID=104270 RepID=UPI003BAB091D
MKILEYILKFGFGITLGIVVIFKVSPILFKKAGEIKNETLINVSLNKLSAECFVPNDTDYIKIEGELANGTDFSKVVDVSEDESFTFLINVLYHEKLVVSKEAKNILPLTLSKEELKSIKEVKVKYDEKREVEKLILKDKYIIGNKSSIVRALFIYFLGSVIFLLGLVSLFVTLIMLFKNIKEFNSSGRLPNLPNTVDNKIKGLKYIMKLLKKQ